MGSFLVGDDGLAGKSGLIDVSSISGLPAMSLADRIDMLETMTRRRGASVRRNSRGSDRGSFDGGTSTHGVKKRNSSFMSRQSSKDSIHSGRDAAGVGADVIDIADEITSCISVGELIVAWYCKSH